jgi:hypothetical protein
MPHQFDEAHVYCGQLLVTPGKKVPTALGVGPLKTEGSTYIEGPTQVGNISDFPIAEGVTMLGNPSGNIKGVVPFYSLVVKTFARIRDFLKVDTMLCVKLIKSKVIYTEVLMAKTKNFIIDHPTKDEMKLVYACLEGPENGVYFRGRISNKDVIYLPEYWTNLVDPTTITVSLTPIGSHQDVIVKRIGENKIYLQANRGMPINCFFHVFATRADIERLVTEVEA